MVETINKQTIIIDLKSSAIEMPKFMQQDSNVIEFVIKENGADADMSNVGKVVVNYKRPDKQIISRLLYAEGNILTYEIGLEEMKVPGYGELELNLYSPDNLHRISTKRFRIYMSNTLGIRAIDQKELTVLQDLFVQVDDLKTYVEQAEDIRTDNETARLTQESTRQQNELAREEAEATRKSNEQLRQTNTQTAITNAENATNSANTAATNVNEATTAANNAASHAQTQGDYAKREADRLTGTDVSVLDNKVTDLSSQLAQKPNHFEVRKETNTEPIKMSELHTEVKEAMTGGSVAVVGENSVGTENLKAESVNVLKLNKLIADQVYAQISLSDDVILVNTKQQGYVRVTDDTLTGEVTGFAPDLGSQIYSSYDTLTNELNYDLMNNPTTIHEVFLNKNDTDLVKWYRGISVNFELDTESSTFDTLILRLAGVKDGAIQILKDITIGNSIGVDTKIRVDEFFDADIIPGDVQALRVYMRAENSMNHNTTVSVKNYTANYGYTKGMNITELKEKTLNNYKDIIEREESNTLETFEHTIDSVETVLFSTSMRKIFIQNNNPCHDVLFAVNDSENFHSVKPKTRIDITAFEINSITLKPNTFIADVLVGGSY